MLWLPLMLFLVSCKKGSLSTPATDAMNLTGNTGRNLTLDVFNIQPARSKSKEHRVCAIGLAGDETFKKENILKRLVCSSQVDTKGSAKLHLKHLPYPVYLHVFHDENLNGVLDFATFNVVVARKDGPAEGVGTIEDPEQSSFKFSRPIWVEVGDSSRRVQMNYQVLPFWQFIQEQSWQYLYGWYLDKAHEINHPDKEKNPFCTKAEECL